MTEVLDVLFVCTANICRSPYMQLVAGHLAGEALHVHSAGTHGLPSQPMDEAMVSRLAGVAVDASGFRSRRVTPALVEASDLVLTAEAAHRRYILEEVPTAFRKVFTLGQFARAVEEHPPAAGRDLVSFVGQRRPPAPPSLDIADPYRRGPDAAAACSDHIDSLLRIVVPALIGHSEANPA